MTLRGVFTQPSVEAPTPTSFWSQHVSSTHARTIRAGQLPLLSPRAALPKTSPRLPALDDQKRIIEKRLAAFREYEESMRKQGNAVWAKTKPDGELSQREPKASPREVKRSPQEFQVREPAPPPPPPPDSLMRSTRKIAVKNSAFARQAQDALNSRFSNMMKAFHYVDLDNSGKLNREELRRALDLWNIPITDAKIDELMAACDADGDGEVDYKEFVDVLARDTVAPAAMGKRDMQSKEAMGVDAQAFLDKVKVKNAKATINEAGAGVPVRVNIDAKQLQKQATDAIAAKFTDVRKAFHFVDVDNSGGVSEAELYRALDLFNIPIDRESVKKLIAQCDQDANGEINYDEFVDALARDTVAPAAMGKRGMQSKEAMGVDAQAFLDKVKVKNAKATINNDDGPGTALKKPVDAKQLQKQATDAIAAKFTDIRKAFHFVDVDNSGAVSRTELYRALDLFNIPVSFEAVDRLIAQCDQDANGEINYDEFVDALARDTVAPAAMGKRGMQSKEAMGVDAQAFLDKVKVKNVRASINS
jgi:Ca2+-binding EF-hand superfamily protein